MAVGLMILAVFTVGFTMLAKRISTTVLTAPMLFISLGYLLAEAGLFPEAKAEELLDIIAEVALVVLLFFDAAQVDLKVLLSKLVWPARMLGIGLPLSIAIGTVAALPFLPEWPLVAVALMAAILAPTDAALGQAVVSNKVVPARVRQGLSVESGINDGLALPAVLLFASLTASVTSQDTTDWLIFAAKQILLAPVVGIAVGFVGGRLLLRAKNLELTSDIYEGIGTLALAGVAFLGAGLIGANGFIAAFVAGLFFGNTVQKQCAFIYEFTESEGQMLSWGAFFLLGVALVPQAISNLTPAYFGLIMVSLFVVRPLAIWISLIGTDATPITRLFFGWFGPRGLATALFALLVIKQIDPETAEPILTIAINAVWISALLHGISAVPAAKGYTAMISKKGPCPETQKPES